MEVKTAINALAALAQETRLSVFRLLVQAGEAGCSAGEMARALDLPGPTLSFHLKALANAELVQSQQDGRHVVYRTTYSQMQALIDYLLENCCAGAPCECAPATASVEAHSK